MGSRVQPTVKMRLGSARSRLRRAAKMLQAASPEDPQTVANASDGGPSPSAAALAAQRDRQDSENMRRLLAFVLRSDSCCVDIGAHRGDVLAEMLRVAPEGRHVALEPIPELAAHLRANFPGVEVHECAASDHTGTSEFAHVRGSAEGWSGLRFRPLPTGEPADLEMIQVKLAPLDEIVGETYVPAVIKIDVEGAEQQVLRGAMGTLRRHRPVVIFEHGSGSAETFDTLPRNIFDLLENEVQYRIFDLDGNGPYGLEEFEQTFYSGARVNFVAHP